MSELTTEDEPAGLKEELASLKEEFAKIKEQYGVLAMNVKELKDENADFDKMKKDFEVMKKEFDNLVTKKDFDISLLASEKFQLWTSEVRFEHMLINCESHKNMRENMELLGSTSIESFIPEKKFGNFIELLRESLYGVKRPSPVSAGGSPLKKSKGDPSASKSEGFPRPSGRPPTGKVWNKAIGKWE